MRRTLLTVVGVVALALAVPGVALAHHGHGRHHHHHHKAKSHHAKFRFRHIGAAGAGAPGPTGPTGPSGPPAPENAGTVVSYSTSTNLLELKLNDESTVKGKVTDRTRIRCVKAMPPTEGEPGDRWHGDDKGEGDDWSHGDMSHDWGDHKDGGDDQDDEAGTAEPPCDSSLLVPGAVVRAAELRIGPGGTEFESIVLVR
ncbi:MAG: hypothetical protein ACRDJ3_09965 [Solirubrobacteraceae bacterium]